MIPTPKVAKVTPRCTRCRSDKDLIRGDGPIVCRPCVEMSGRQPDYDDRMREGYRP